MTIIKFCRQNIDKKKSKNKILGCRNEKRGVSKSKVYKRK